MKVDKKQLPQLIILGVLVVGCVCYASFNVFKPKATAPAPAAKSEQAAAADAQTPGTEEPDGEALAPAGVFPNLTAVAMRRDPFTPQIVCSLDNQPSPQPSAYTRPSNRGVIQRLDDVLPPVNPYGGSAGGGGIPSIVPVEDKDPDFVITGVIRGDENVAIIRVGEGERHVVKQGQLIDGRYKVLRVDGDGVVLADKNRRIHLKLGGAKNAS